MKAAVLLLPALLALAPAAHAAPAAGPPHVSVRYQGNLRDALEKIAAEGNINLVAVGNLDIPAQVVLHDVTPEQALETIAQAYHLTLNKNGNIWTVAAPGALATAPAPANAPSASAAPAKPSEDEEDSEPEEKDDDDQDQAEQATPPTSVPGMNVPGMGAPPIAPRPPHAPRMHPGGNDLVGTGPQTVNEDQTVDSAVAYGGPLKVDGHVTGDAVAFGGNVELGPRARVDGDAVAFGGTVLRQPGSQVRGEVVNFGGRGVGSLVAQGITRNMVLHPQEIEAEYHHEGMSSLAFRLLEFVVCFGVGFLLLMFAPNAMKKVEQEIAREPLRCGVTGLVAFLALCVLSVLLAITIIGIVPAVALWLAVAVALAMGLTAVAHEIGMRLPAFQGRKTQALVLALGVLILIAVQVIPIVGTISLFLLAMLGLGAVTRTRFGTRPKGFPEPA